MKNNIIIFFCSVLVLCMLSGCGKKNNIKSDLNELTIDQITDETDSEGLNVPTETVEHVIASSDGSATKELKYDVVNPEITTEKLPVYKMKKIEVDSAYLEGIAKTLFDDGEYKVLIPALCCDSVEADRQLDYYNNELPELEKLYTGRDELFVGAFIVCETEVLMSDEKDNITNIVNDGVLYHYSRGDVDATRALMIGTIDGEHYVLEYFDLYENITLNVIKIFPSGAFSEMDSFKHDNLDSKKYMYDDSDNKCDLDFAAKQSDDIIKKLGRDDMSVGEIRDIALYDVDTEKTFLDGYSFVYICGYDNILGVNVLNDSTLLMKEKTGPVRPLSIRNVEELQEFGFDSKMTANQDRIDVKYDSAGLTTISINTYYYDYECMEKNATLMSYDKIDQAAVQFAVDTFDFEVEENISDNVDPDTVELKYVAVKYDEEYVLTPAWVYYNDCGGSTYDIAWVAINALDGSVIQFMYN